MTTTKRGPGPWINIDPPPAAQLLREELNNLNISYAEAARRLGISQKHLSQAMVGTAGVGVDLAVALELELGIDGRSILHQQVEDQFDRTRRLLTEDS